MSNRLFAGGQGRSDEEIMDLGTVFLIWAVVGALALAVAFTVGWCC